MTRVAVLVSGGGTNLQALVDAEKSGVLRSGKISLVVSSRAGAYALKRAEENGIPVKILAQKNYTRLNNQADPVEYDRAMLEALNENGIGLVVLAGFLLPIGKELLAAFPERIINVHPSLLPSFGGRGFYGLKVHEAALERGVKLSGATVHYVNESIDGGKIISQKAVDVKEGDTPETLQRRIMEEAEWILLPAAVEMICKKIAAEEKET
ncbi:MAG: phosphoribosylglycinamide formyltransferase [Treponema sp.]|nr:phosphoribosylglycinamide formyltransferase [Treponema sp.]